MKKLVLPRRAALLAPLALAAAGPEAPPAWAATLAGRVGQGLLRSYDVDGTQQFDLAHANCAYTYDNAVTGIALLATGHLAQARLLGEALLAAQARDRFYTDGRLRNAYAAGPIAATGPYPLPGWWEKSAAKWVEDAYQVGTATGVVAWAILFWAALARATNDQRFTAAAARAADWVERATRVPNGYSGGFIGWEPGPTRVGWASTEHNLDLAVAFAALGRPEPAAHARAFVAAMWRPAEGRFNIGLQPNGTPNQAAAADANLWPLLAPNPDPAWSRALAWVLAHQAVPPANPAGIGFNEGQTGIWLEGTAYLALAARQANRPSLAAAMLSTLQAQTAPSGLIFACTTPTLATGLSTGIENAPFLYFRRPHIAATAWAALAAAGRSPFEEKA